MNTLLLAALLLDFSGISYNAEFEHQPDGHGDVRYIDYYHNPAETELPQFGLFFRASFGYVGEDTHIYPKCGTVVWLACFVAPEPPPVQPPIIEPPVPPVITPPTETPESPVPEPSTAILMLIAFALTGVVVRTRKAYGS